MWSPPTELKSISTPWSFFKLGMNLFGPFKAAPGQLQWLIVAVDYFTKWIEAEPVATITLAQAQKFLARNIISRFRIPTKVIMENRTQFIDKGFQEMIFDFQIKQHFSFVEHPQSNGKAKVANKVIIDGLRKRMERGERAYQSRYQELH